jgi:hypothetical protein
VFVALGIQQAMRMRRVILSTVTSTAVHNLSTLPHKRHELGQKGIESNMSALIFCKAFVWRIVNSEKNLE